MKDLTFSVKMSILSRPIIVLTVSNGRLRASAWGGGVGVYMVTGDGDFANVNINPCRTTYHIWLGRSQLG